MKVSRSNAMLITGESAANRNNDNISLVPSTPGGEEVIAEFKLLDEYSMPVDNNTRSMGVGNATQIQVNNIIIKNTWGKIREKRLSQKPLSIPTSNESSPAGSPIFS